MIARILVGLVLLVAGVAKLRDRPADMPAALPWVELVLGALLVVGIGGRWTAFPAVALFTAFLVVVWRRVRAGDNAPCGCFGRASTAPTTMRTVARNAALVAVSVVGALT